MTACKFPSRIDPSPLFAWFACSAPASDANQCRAQVGSSSAILNSYPATLCFTWILSLSYSIRCLGRMAKGHQKLLRAEKPDLPLCPANSFRLLSTLAFSSRAKLLALSGSFPSSIKIIKTLPVRVFPSSQLLGRNVARARRFFEFLKDFVCFKSFKNVPVSFKPFSRKQFNLAAGGWLARDPFSTRGFLKFHSFFPTLCDVN